MEFMECQYSCGAEELGDFGGGEYGVINCDYILDFNNYRIGLEEAIKTLSDKLCLRKRIGATKIVFATTTSNQPLAEQLLTRCGFYTSKTAGKTSGGRTIRGWFLPLHEYEGV